jgi:hypothetical protein
MRNTARRRPRGQRLATAVRLIRSGKGLQDVLRAGLAGCPEGAWPETIQAWRRIQEALPFSGDRCYTTQAIVEALFRVGPDGRYQYRFAQETADHA